MSVTKYQSNSQGAYKNTLENKVYNKLLNQDKIQLTVFRTSTILAN
jgi:hypothetical protein